MDQEGALFSGPKRYAVTAAKYMSPFKEQVVTAKRLKQQQQEQQACEGVSRHPNSEGFVRPLTSPDMYAFDQSIQAGSLLLFLHPPICLLPAVGQHSNDQEPGASRVAESATVRRHRS